MVYFNYERWCYRVGIINDRIWERRISLGLTLLNVAEQLGVKEATAQRYESGAIKSISHETISRLSEILSCTPSYLMGWDATSRPASHVSDEFQIKIIIEYRKSDEITQAMVLRALAIDETIEIKRNA